MRNNLFTVMPLLNTNSIEFSFVPERVHQHSYDFQCPPCKVTLIRVIEESFENVGLTLALLSYYFQDPCVKALSEGN